MIEPHATELDPMYRENVRRMREARLTLRKVSALVANGSLPSAAADVAQHLGKFDDAWSGARTWAKSMHKHSGGARVKKLFDDNLVQIADLRKELIGVSESLPQEEHASSLPTSESLFGRLRKAISDFAA